METDPPSIPGNRWWHQSANRTDPDSGVSTTLDSSLASASTPEKQFYSHSLFPPSHRGFSLLSLDMVTHRWNRLPWEQSARGSCFTKISRHNVCPVTAAQRTWVDILRPIACTAHGPEFPHCCPKATGNGTGSQLRRQEKEGVVSVALPRLRPRPPQ